MATPKLSDLEPDERNANKGTPRGQKQIVGSVQRNGAGRSGLLDKNNKIVAGNKSTEAFAEVFGEDVEPIIVETDGTRPVYVKRTDLDLDDPDPNNTARKLAYEDNLTSALSFDLNIDVVALDIEAGFDFGEIDITPVDLAGLGVEVENGAGEDTEPQIDKAAELQEKWGTALGQLWQLGEHRLICGDCTDEEVVRRVMAGEVAEILLTSPPYNVAAQSSLPNKNKYQTQTHTYGSAFDDKKSQDEYFALLAAFTSLALKFCQFCFVNIQSVAGNKLALIEYLWAFKEYYADTIIWDKIIAEPAMAKNVLNSRFEYVHIFSEKANRSIGSKVFRGSIDNVLSLSSRQDKGYSGIHKATFALEFAEYFIKMFSNNNECILDLFLGSGTTLIACQNLSRQCRAVEISPAYIAVTLERFHQHSGVMPELIQGQT